MNPKDIIAPRLQFRKLTSKDAPAWEEFLSNHEAVKLFPPFGEVKNYALEWMEKQQLRYARDGFGLFALIEKSSGQFVGQCVEEVKELEIGYHLLPRFWKHGYATEAAIACRNFIFENNLRDSIISIIDVRNLSSMKVAMRNGMKREKQTRWRDLEVFIYRIHKSEWQK
jgi:RimJ/RimL family protein N-acetyltransferase